MLQIIGFLGCAYLVVKGFELWAQRGSFETPNNAFMAGALLAWLSAVLFAFLFYSQGSQMSQAVGTVDTPAIDTTKSDCIIAADSVAEMDDC